MNGGRRCLCGGKIIERVNQRLPSWQIDPNRRFIEKKKRVAAKERAGKENTLAFALRAASKLLIDDAITAKLMQKRHRVLLVLVGKARPPGCERSISTGKDHLSRR
jgi:hypothetical protein